MRIWQEARVFTNDVYKMMSSCRDYGFRDQIQRAAVSIMNNIAEGFESGSDNKFINFLNIEMNGVQNLVLVRNLLTLSSPQLKQVKLVSLQTLLLLLVFLLLALLWQKIL